MLGGLEAGRLGVWEAERLGGWETGKLGGLEAARLRGCEVGRLGGWEARRRTHSRGPRWTLGQPRSRWCGTGEGSSTVFTTNLSPPFHCGSSGCQSLGVHVHSLQRRVWRVAAVTSHQLALSDSHADWKVLSGLGQLARSLPQSPLGEEERRRDTGDTRGRTCGEDGGAGLDRGVALLFLMCQPLPRGLPSPLGQHSCWAHPGWHGNSLPVHQTARGEVDNHCSQAFQTENRNLKTVIPGPSLQISLQAGIPGAASASAHWPVALGAQSSAPGHIR